LHEEAPEISELAPNTPLALQRIVQRGLAKNPEQRFQSAADLAFALSALSDSDISHTGRKQGNPSPRRQSLLLAVAAIAFLLLIFILGYSWISPTPAPTVSNYVQLTHDGQQKALIGTDGARLYLALETSAQATIAEIPISGGEPTPFSRIPLPHMVPLGLSPDGSEFLVVDGQGVPPTGPLWRIPIVGGSPRRLGDAVGEDAALSPDQSKLVYVDGANLFLANADGSNPRKLVTAAGVVSNPVWSPDASHLRFDTSESVGNLGQHLIWEVSADGTNLHQLLAGWHNPPDECCGQWTADGKYFVFQSKGQIWASPQERSFIAPKAKPVALTSSPMSLFSPVPSKDGKKLFLVGRTYRGDLNRYDSRSSQFVPFLGGISAEYLDFSRDGQWVAYTSYPEGTIWRSKLDGSERLQLTFAPMYAVMPRWSPDGQSIVFFEFPESSSKPARMYELSAEGGAPRLLLPTDSHHQQDPNWSPDGNKIIFAGNANYAALSGDAPAIRVLDLATHKAIPIPGSQGFFSPRWSPDGKYIAAFTSDSTTVMLFDFASQTWTPIAKGSMGWLNWSRNGQYLYAIDFSGTGAVLKIGIADHKVEKAVSLKDFVMTGRFGGSLALAPDDSPLLLRDAGTQDVYAVDWQIP
jgi:Tol biopolymer transport system component